MANLGFPKGDSKLQMTVLPVILIGFVFKYLNFRRIGYINSPICTDATIYHNYMGMYNKQEVKIFKKYGWFWFHLLRTRA